MLKKLALVAVLTLSTLWTLPALATSPADANVRSATTGFLVVAPDRGFQGNEEARDIVAAFADRYLARLVFVTDERTGTVLEAAITELRAEGGRDLVFLPLFVSPSHPRLELVRQLAETAAPDAIWGRPFGASYLAVEALADRFRQVTRPAGSRLVVIASGAEDEASGSAMAADLDRLVEHAASGFGFATVETLIAPARATALPEMEEAFQAKLESLAGDGTVVVQFDQGAELDGMMRFGAQLARQLPEGAALISGDLTPDPLVSLWLAREANRHLPIPPERLGVVALAHGSDFHWNETMRAAVAPLAERYLVETCFSMADRNLVERAIRRLEDRGARAVVVVRIFGMETSFQGSVERMLGLDVEGSDGLAAASPESMHGHGHGHGHHNGPPAPRIRTALPTATAGGLEDHPLFAQALLDRALRLSEDPDREIVLLAAHGLGDDEGNDHWLEVLGSIADQMRRSEGARFAAIETVTWREDWPDQREPSVARARAIVEGATAESKRVIVIPARTSGQGPAPELLEGLTFSLGDGFAPHPLFTKWMEEQVIEAAGRLPLIVADSLFVAADRDVDRLPASHRGR